MNLIFDREMIQQIYDNYLKEIRDLKEKKEAAVNLQNPTGRQMTKLIDAKIRKIEEELEGIKYALNNMT